MLHHILKDPAREVAINQEISKGAKWVIEGPLRRVPPYYYTYLTFCKQRWIGQTLLDVFASEFRDRSKEYYQRAIEEELVLVNDKVATVDQILCNGDLIMHRTHKHEQPVTSRKIKIVHEDDDLVVIDKPNGLPVHPTGRFNFNTVMAILEHENKIVCHPCNRLDRLTSGLMFLAKNSKSAEKLGQQIRDRTVQKEYLALVVGEFPLRAGVEGEMLTVDPKLSLNMMSGDIKTYTFDDIETVIVEESDESDVTPPTAPETVETTISRSNTDEAGLEKEPEVQTNASGKKRRRQKVMKPEKDTKFSKTTFQRVSYDKKSNRSLVLCRPRTGRTHQIRVHLQHLGFPISNDPIYSNPAVWGPELGRNLKLQTAPVESIRLSLDNCGKTEPAHSYDHPDSKGEMLSGETCSVCDTALYTDPGVNDLDLYLHALKYEAHDKKWSYETEMPWWAVAEHSRFMELALNEARKAPDLDGAFAVGAVLVHNGTVLETGYTRELEGNTHAEQNALTKLANRGVAIPPGTCLYTTMEPCTYRLSGNLPCSDRVIANRNITTTFVGVLEPGTFVENNTSRSKLQDEGLVYLQVPGYAEEALKIAEKGHNKNQNGANNNAVV